MTKNYHIEKWRSNQKNEIHYFLKNKKEVYIFGYNPKFIPQAKLKLILKIIGLDTLI